MIIFSRDFNSLDTTDGPTISIINNIKNYKKKDKILIINTLTRDRERYEKFKYKNLNIQTLTFHNFFEFIKLFYSNYHELKKHNIVEFHCVYDFLGCFLSSLFLRLLNKRVVYNFFLYY